MNPHIFNPNYNKNIWFNTKNNFKIKTTYLGNNIYKEEYYKTNSLDFIIQHQPPKNKIQK